MRALSSLDGERPLPDPLPMPPELPASLYGRLRDEVRADQLGVDQQETVLRRIRELWAEEGDADRALVLIEELGNRPDLLASVVPDVEALTMEIAADSAPTSRRRRGLDRWERLGRARQAGAGLGALSLQPRSRSHNSAVISTTSASNALEHGGKSLAFPGCRTLFSPAWSLSVSPRYSAVEPYGSVGSLSSVLASRCSPWCRSTSSSSPRGAMSSVESDPDSGGRWSLVCLPSSPAPSSSQPHR